jgi:hypothetical protein
MIYGEKKGAEPKSGSEPAEPRLDRHLLLNTAAAFRFTVTRHSTFHDRKASTRLLASLLPINCPRHHTGRGFHRTFSDLFARNPSCSQCTCACACAYCVKIQSESKSTNLGSTGFSVEITTSAHKSLSAFCLLCAPSFRHTHIFHPGESRVFPESPADCTFPRTQQPQSSRAYLSRSPLLRI